MKNIRFSAVTNVRDFLISRFRSDQIISSLHNNNSIVNNVINNVSIAPLTVFKQNKNSINRLNHTSWFRSLSLRDEDYSDKVRGDLYLIHELAHISTMSYGYYPNFQEWKSKMMHNEQIVSLLTESQMFFDVPNLRENIDVDTIWVDRYLSNQCNLQKNICNHDLYKKNPHLFQKLLLKHFNSINIDDLNSTDIPKKRTAKYILSDSEWCDIWRNDYQTVEYHMQKFYELAISNKGSEASKMHIEWLDKFTTEGVPFYDNATKFYQYYSKLNVIHEENAPTVLITGSNRGIGLEFVKQYASRGWNVIGTCREPTDKTELLNLSKNHSNIKVHQLDITNSKHINKLASELKDQQIDLLLHNAGIKGYDAYGPEKFWSFDEKTLYSTMETNTFGIFNLTKAFLKNLENSKLKAICSLSTEVGDDDEAIKGGKLSYRLSKSALDTLIYTMSGDFKNSGSNLISFGIRPGWVKTGMTGSYAPQTTKDSVSDMVKTIDKIVHDRSNGIICMYDGKMIN
jgi:NAD(P)-dependent dehydrogenase (short-subunit alcohol dehydrogenase family)